MTVVARGTVFGHDPPTLAYEGELKFGVTTALAADTSGLVAADDDTNAIAWTYRVEGSCEVDNAGEVSITAATNPGDVCSVRAIGTSAGFVDVVTAPVVLTVAAGDLDFDSRYPQGGLYVHSEVGGATPPDHSQQCRRRERCFRELGELAGRGV